MSQWGSWSSDSQQHAQMCILESQIETKEKQLSFKDKEIVALKEEIKRLRALIDALHGIKENLNTGDILDRFK